MDIDILCGKILHSFSVWLQQVTAMPLGEIAVLYFSMVAVSYCHAPW